MAQHVFSLDDFPISESKRRTIRKRWLQPEVVENESGGVLAEKGTDTFRQLVVEDGYDWINGYELQNYSDGTELFKELAHEVFAELPSDASKKDKIIVLKLVFGTELSTPSNSLINRTLSVTKYANDFIYFPSSQKVAQKEYISKSEKSNIISRDGGCTNCGTDENLVVHHILPRIEDGTNDPANLATLCEDCHTMVHPEWRRTTYNSVDEFWSWANDD